MSENNHEMNTSAKRKIKIDETKRLKKSLFRWRVALPITAVVTLTCGVLFGYALRFPYAQPVINSIQGVGKKDSDTKFDTILEIMSENWFFAKDIENVSTRLTDQALYGMTANEEDPHTTYMSAEEVASFTQSINRNFVGIGVSYRTEMDGSFVITSVMHHSPAEGAGLMAGDVIYAVDGEAVEGLSSDQLKERITGEEGTNVRVSIKRGVEILTFTMTRAEISGTVYGSIKEDAIGYLDVEQFGDSTASEIRDYLNEFADTGVEKLIIDLRGNGGGYLDSVRAVSSLFLPGNTVVLQQVYSDDSVVVTKTVDGVQYDFSPIVILIDGDTASASEVFTLAMTENRTDVTTVGTLSYGKGTVQITSMFDDGSALKYTTSKWISSRSVWVNHIGITPDEVIELPTAINTAYTALPEETVYHLDDVAESIEKAQIGLSFLGYDIDRTDGYLSKKTAEAIRSFRQDHGLAEGDTLDEETYEMMVSRLIYLWNSDESLDPQLNRAKELLKTSVGVQVTVPEGTLPVASSDDVLYESSGKEDYV